MRPLTRIASISISMASALIAAACDETAPRGPGSIQVAATMSGHQDEPLFFPYGISIDNGTPREAVTQETVNFQVNGLAHGTHVVQVVEIDGIDIPPACGELPRKEVQLAGDDTADVIIDVKCSRITGDVLVSAITNGTDLDLNGYQVVVDQQIRGIVSPNSSTLIRFLTPGPHSIGLTDVATNCTTPAQQNLSMVAGGQAQALFHVTCSAVGVLKFVTTITGADRDPDGAVIQIDNGPAQPLTLNGTMNVRVSAGSRSYSIGDIQPNCSVGGAVTGTHTVAQGDTVVVNLAATCSAISLGSVGVTLSEPTADTLSNPTNTPTPALDVLGVTGRYTPGFMIVVVRFNRAVASAIQDVSGSVFGYMQFDVDENVNTGIPPASNSFGGSASMGGDYLVDFFGTDTASTILVQTSTPPGFIGIVGRVRVHFQADSMMVFMPLNKFADDQNMAMTLVIGTSDRPTDVGPNTGTFLLRPPASVVAGASLRLPPQVVRGRSIRIEDLEKWRKLTP